LVNTSGDENSSDEIEKDLGQPLKTRCHIVEWLNVWDDPSISDLVVWTKDSAKTITSQSISHEICAIGRQTRKLIPILETTVNRKPMSFHISLCQHIRMARQQQMTLILRLIQAVRADFHDGHEQPHSPICINCETSSRRSDGERRLADDQLLVSAAEVEGFDLFTIWLNKESITADRTRPNQTRYEIINLVMNLSHGYLDWLRCHTA
jgi:hypothetical protein